MKLPQYIKATAIYLIILALVALGAVLMGSTPRVAIGACLVFGTPLAILIIPIIVFEIDD